MSSDQNKYGVRHLIGGTDLPQDANPAIRGTVRRSDPAANPAPHFTGLAGTTLNLNYTPTGAQAIVFTSDDLAVAISDINAVDPLNLEAVDDSGYLKIRSLTGGSKNFLKIISGSAAPILGFRLDPLPGSASFAGEVGTAPAGAQTGQDNPHGTALLSGDEDLGSAGINRAIIGALLHVERIAGDLDLETLVVQEVPVTVLSHPISGEKVFRLQDPTLRIPIRGFGINVSNPAAGLLDPQFMVMENDGSGQSREFLDLADATTFGRITNVYYDDLTNTLNDTLSFATWGTPDGKSIFNKAASDDKHVATAITTIDGDIINVVGATFQTLNCSPGDTALIAGATNNDPFNHDGEFVITEVFSEETIRVRPKSTFDRTFSSSETPRGLNQDIPGGTSYGTLKILIGDFISANDVVFQVLPISLADGPHFIRMLVGSRIQETRLPLVAAHKPSLAKSDRRMAELLRIHAITEVSFRHHTHAIDGSAAAGSPDSLAADTLENQLIEILGHINNLIAGQVTYAGGVNWADGTTNPSTNLEAQVDKMLSDLAVGAGAAKIHAAASGDLLAATLRAQIDQIAAEWSKLNRTENITGLKTFTQLVALDGGATVGAIGVSSAGDVEITGVTKSFKTNPGADTVPAIITATAPTNHRLLWEFLVKGAVKCRLYASNTGTDGEGLEITVNAVWGGANWSRDDNLETATKVVVSKSTFGLWSNIAAAGTFLESAWVRVGDFGLSSFAHLVTGNMGLSGLVGAASVLELGSGLLGTNADKVIPRLLVNRTGFGRVLIAELGPSTRRYRLYSVNSGASTEALELTQNAKWNDATSLWSRDDNADDSTLFLFREDGLRIRYHAGTQADTWAENAWQIENFELRSDNFTSLTMASLFANGAFIEFPGVTAHNAFNTGTQQNRMTPNNMVHAWGAATLGLGNPVGQQGYGLELITLTGVAPTRAIRVRLKNAFVDGSFAIGWQGSYTFQVGSVVGERNVTWRVQSRSTQEFQIIPYRASDNVWLDPGAATFGGTISFIVCGKQVS